MRIMHEETSECYRDEEVRSSDAINSTAKPALDVDENSLLCMRLTLPLKDEEVPGHDNFVTRWISERNFVHKVLT